MLAKHISRHRFFAFVLLVGGLAQAFPAAAGFLSVVAEPEDSSLAAYFDYDWGLKADGVNAWLNLTETWGPNLDGTYGVGVTGLVDEDPTISITKEVTNSSGSDWLGYIITLDASEAPTFVGTPTSNTMTLITQTDHALIFGLPSPVPTGASVSFVFDVQIPDEGPFSFSLSQTPTSTIPAPATLALMFLAMLCLAATVRRRAVVAAQAVRRT